METIPFLTKEDVATLDGILEDYLKKSEAAFTVIIDRGGTVIAQRGDDSSMDVTIMAALAAGSFAATGELAQRIGEKEFNALYQQGVGRHILMSALDEHSIMVTVFGEHTTIGLVRFYTTNAVAQLAALLKTLRQRDPADIPLSQDGLEAADAQDSTGSGKIFG